MLLSAAAWVSPTRLGADTVGGVGESSPPPDEHAISSVQARRVIEKRKCLSANIANPTRLPNRIEDRTIVMASIGKINRK
jgi:hypothetical protein